MFNESKENLTEEHIKHNRKKGSPITQHEKDVMKEMYDGSNESIEKIMNVLGVAISTVYYWTNHHGYYDRQKKRLKKISKKIIKIKVDNAITIYVKWLIDQNLLTITGNKEVITSLLVDKFKSYKNKIK